MESGSGGTNKRCPAQGIRYETEFKSEDKDGCLPFRGMRRWEILAHCIIAALQRITKSKWSIAISIYLTYVSAFPRLGPVGWSGWTSFFSVSLFLLGPSSPLMDASLTEIAEIKGNKTNNASVFQASGHVIPSNVLLAKTSHMGKTR